MKEIELKEKGLELLYRVGHGNHNGSYLTDLVYYGDRRSNQMYSLVGKGITFDSGGLNLKGRKGIQTMYMDKCGGCSVLSIFKYAV